MLGRTGALRWFGEKAKASPQMGHLTREPTASFRQEKTLQAKGEAGLGTMGQEGLLERTKGRPL